MSLRIRAVSPEPPLLVHTSSESRGIFRQKARSLAPLNGWACAVKICHDGMLEDTNSLDGAVSVIAVHWVNAVFLPTELSSVALTTAAHVQTQQHRVWSIHTLCDFLASKGSLFQNLCIISEPPHEKICFCHMRIR